MNKIQRIQQIFEDEFLLFPGQIMSNARSEPTITARHAFSYYLHKVEGLPLNSVACIMSWKHHGTIKNGVKRFQNFLDTEPKTKKRYENAIERIERRDD